MHVTDYIDVEQRCAALSIPKPEGFCILPRRFEDAQTVSDLRHESSALDLKVLFRRANLPITVYQPDGATIPYLQENDNTWTGPILLLGYAVLTSDPNALAVSLSIIANYLTDFFRGNPEPVRAKLSFVVEVLETETKEKETKTGTTKTTKVIRKRFDFDGPPDELPGFPDFIKDNI
jgi:hypothetical protein